LAWTGGPKAAADELFKPASQSPIALVRVAAHFADLARIGSIVTRLRELGYRVCVNLMQASNETLASISRAAERASEWGSVDVLYLADSLGSMAPEGMAAAVKALAAAWDGPIGVHAHNNKGQALANSLAALDAGASWVDGTLLGMGRGAGNVHTEHLLIELERREPGKYYCEALFPLVLEQFEGLRQKYAWGPSLLYFLSGSYGIHPTYVQEMLSRGGYDPHHILSALEFLRTSGGQSFSQVSLDQAMLGSVTTGTGRWDATGWAQGRDVLLVAAGPGAMQHVEAMATFIEQRSPVVICLNVNEQFPADKVTAYAACHRTRLLMDASRYRHLKRPLIAPLEAVPDGVRAQLNEITVLDYGMRVEAHTYRVCPMGCTIPAPLVAGYAFAVAEAGGAKRILLAGFDGYSDLSDPRRAVMVSVLEAYQAREQALPLLAVTPTNYQVPAASIYSPAL
jgi:4-hydroxy 2-oxovalerate aldolase